MAQTHASHAHASHALHRADANHTDGVSLLTIEGQEASAGLAGSPLAVQGFFIGWIAIGIAGAYWLAPRGHDRRILAALGAGLGPLMVIVVMNMVRSTERAAHPIVVRSGVHHGGQLDVLVILSDRSTVASLVPSIDAVGEDLGWLILARVVAFEWADGDLDNDVINEAVATLVAADRLVPLGAQLEVHPGTPDAAARRFRSERPNRAIVFYAIEGPSAQHPTPQR